MHNPVTQRIQALREEMKKNGMDLYVVPTSDFHESEYVGEYFKTRKYITGFTGSAGTAVITAKEAGLWTDGRYFIQAEKELQQSGITLYRAGEENVPTVAEFLQEKLPKNGCLGFDGRTVNAKTGALYQNIAEEKGGRLKVTEDLVGAIWKDRPPLSGQPFFLLEECYSGCSTRQKIAYVREKMREAGTEYHILTSLCDIAWLLNVRGGDIANVPVVLSYLVLGQNDCVWFLQQEIITEEQRTYLKEHQITTKPYEAFYSWISSLPEDAGILLDTGSVNYCVLESLPPKAQVADLPNPTEWKKAVKNKCEVDNTIAAHIRDGVAFTRFMYWLKTNIGKIRITEISAADYLEKQRREQEHFLDLSFPTISAYGANAAMMHYTATVETDTELQPEGFLLVDSGGHYLEGTTDITRTVALGDLTDEMKRYFTAVCRSNLNLAAAKFLYGCRGINLDILAREPLWELGMDYRCGTGHGVGYILNVHEGPNSFRWRQIPGRESAVLEEGMITTDEPGVYIEGAYGIRTENELVCQKAEKNEYGQFMCFENITFAPIDLDAILPEEMTGRERELLNAYHKKVYDTLSPYLTEEENIWLKEYTRAV